MEDTKKLISENIMKYRKLSGLTQNELAEKLNYSDKAVSKWERGDSLPDVIVLKEMANLFGISLDSLTSTQVEKPKRLKSIFNKIYTSKFLISSASTLLVWLVATIVFVMLSLFTQLDKLWLVFILAIPLNCIVLIALCKFWKSGWYNFVTVSSLVLSIALSLYLSLNYENLWLLFTICIPLVALAFLWFVARHKIFRHKK